MLMPSLDSVMPGADQPRQEKEDSLLAAQLNELSKRDIVSIVVGVPSIAVVAWAHWGSVPRANLIYWFIGMFIVQIVRFTISQKHFVPDRSGSDLTRWRNLRVLVNAVYGIAWGAIFFLLNTGQSDFLFMFKIAAIAATLGVTLNTMGVVLPVYVGFVAPITIFSSFFIIGDTPYLQVEQRFSLLIGVLTYTALLLAAARNMSRLTRSAIEHGLEREGMLAQSKLAKAELERHHLDLEERIFARTAELARSKDAADAASRAKSAFLANMSHELRTPMNGIMGMTDLVLRRATDPKQIDWLKKSKASAQHLLSVINDILDISKIEAEQMTLEERNFSLTQVIDDSLLMQNEAAKARSLSLSREIDSGVPDLVCGDAMRLKQILINFIGNAVKFSERGQITVRAHVVEEDTLSILLKIEVADQGIGISPEQQVLLFQAFSQADTSTSRKYGGTGLGLTISRRIANLMGGDVGMSSKEGHGSTFWATVRIRRAVHDRRVDARPETYSAREKLAHRFSGYRILVAEDDPLNQEVSALLLSDASLKTDLANNGQEALEMAGNGGYALILMDVQMPIMNGLDAARAIRRLPGMSEIPILAITANAFNEDRDACLAAGMNAHVSKPIDPDAFYATLWHWLKKSETSTQTRYAGDSNEA